MEPFNFTALLHGPCFLSIILTKGKMKNVILVGLWAVLSKNRRRFVWTRAQPGVSVCRQQWELAHPSKHQRFPARARDRQSFLTQGYIIELKGLGLADSSKARRTNFFLRADVFDRARIPPNSSLKRSNSLHRNTARAKLVSCWQGQSAAISGSDFGSNTVGSPGRSLLLKTPRWKHEVMSRTDKFAHT